MNAPKIDAPFGTPEWCAQVKTYGTWMDTQTSEDDSRFEDEFEYEFVQRRGAK